MGKLTFKSFRKLHNRLLNDGIIEYIKGYEYAKNSALIQRAEPQELGNLWRSYLKIGVKDNYNAFGHAYAIAEMMHKGVEQIAA